MDHRQPPPPKDLSGYLDALARVMFQAGISWRVVDAKWPGIREAFHGFDVQRVAKFPEADIDRLMGDPRVIRNRKKLEAIRQNAREMLALETEYKGFKALPGFFGRLRSHQESSAQALRVRRRYRQLVLPVDGWA